VLSLADLDVADKAGVLEAEGHVLRDPHLRVEAIKQVRPGRHEAALALSPMPHVEGGQLRATAVCVLVHTKAEGLRRTRICLDQALAVPLRRGPQGEVTHLLERHHLVCDPPNAMQLTRGRSHKESRGHHTQDHRHTRKKSRAD